MLNLFTSAASLLLGELPEGTVGQHAHRLLTALGYVPAAAIRLVRAKSMPRRAIAPACSELLRNLFEFSNSTAPDAPGLVSFARRIRSRARRCLASGQSAGRRLRRGSDAAGGVSGMRRRRHRISFPVAARGRPPDAGRCAARRQRSIRGCARACRDAGVVPQGQRSGAVMGIAQSVFPTDARSCCRPMCACAGRPRSSNLRRRFR